MINVDSMKKMIAILLVAAWGQAVASLAGNATPDVSVAQAEFAKYYRAVTGKAVPQDAVKFVIDPAVSKTGKDAYTIVSSSWFRDPSSGFRVSDQQPATLNSQPATRDHQQRESQSQARICEASFMASMTSLSGARAATGSGTATSSRKKTP